MPFCFEFIISLTPFEYPSSDFSKSSSARRFEFFALYSDVTAFCSVLSALFSPVILKYSFFSPSSPFLHSARAFSFSASSETHFSSWSAHILSASLFAEISFFIFSFLSAKFRCSASRPSLFAERFVFSFKSSIISAF